MLLDLLASLPAKDADAASLALQFAVVAAIAACIALRKPLLAVLRSACLPVGRSTSHQELATSAKRDQSSPPQPALTKHASSRGAAISPERRP